MQVQQISGDHAGLVALRREAVIEGYDFLERLARDWSAGTNRFEAPGETLVGAFSGAQLVGVAGLNLEPYEPAPGRARLRHLYVSRACRRRGVGRALVTHLLAEAGQRFAEIRLRTDSAEAAAFYESLGFAPVRLGTASHVRLLAETPVQTSFSAPGAAEA